MNYERKKLSYNEYQKTKKPNKCPYLLYILCFLLIDNLQTCSTCARSLPVLAFPRGYTSAVHKTYIAYIVRISPVYYLTRLTSLQERRRARTANQRPALHELDLNTLLTSRRRWRLITDVSADELALWRPRQTR